MLLNNQQITEEIKKEIKICIETNENENTQPKTYGILKSSAKGQVHNNTSLLKETREKSNKQSKFTPKATIKRRNEEPKGQQKERNHKKNKAEINEKEAKETIAKINNAKSWFFEKINKIDKPLARLIKKKREKNQMNKNRNQNGEITTDNT